MRSSSVMRAAQVLAVAITILGLPTLASAQTATSTTAASTTTSAPATTTTTTHVDPPCAFMGGCLPQPPAAFVAGTGGEQRGVTLGTCWSLPPAGGQPGPTACTSVVLVPPPALVVEQGADLTLRFEPSLPASAITVVRRPSSDEPFAQPIAQQLSLPAGSGGRFGSDFPAGSWDLEVTARFAQGQVPYFFRIRVTAASQGPDAPSARIAFTG